MGKMGLPFALFLLAGATWDIPSGEAFSTCPKLRVSARAKSLCCRKGSSLLCLEMADDGLNDLVKKKAELETSKKLLANYQDALARKTDLQRDIQELELQMEKIQERELLAIKGRSELQEGGSYEDDSDQLPTGFDSLPWSDGEIWWIACGVRLQVLQGYV